MTSSEFDSGAAAPDDHLRDRSLVAEVFVVEWEVAADVVADVAATANPAVDRWWRNEGVVISLDG